VFIAYAPADAPEIALCVYLEHRGHGGAAAGPVARRILEHYFGLGDALPAPVLVEGD
jgi:penicillin-binding protein 2